MVGKRCELSVTRREYGMKISPLTEDVIQVSPTLGIPAVLGTETADTSFLKGLVKLFFQ